LKLGPAVRDRLNAEDQICEGVNYGF
jgi:hypothetical protein